MSASRTVMSCSVLPRPGSSASSPPPSAMAPKSHRTPSSWCGLSTCARKTTASIMAQQPSSVKRSQAQEAGGSDARVGAMAGGQLEPRPSEPTAGRRAEVTRHAAEATDGEQASAAEVRGRTYLRQCRRDESMACSSFKSTCPDVISTFSVARWLPRALALRTSRGRGEALAEAMGGEHKPMGGRGLLSGALVGLLEGAGALAAAPATATAASGERLSIAAWLSSTIGTRRIKLTRRRLHAL